MNSFGCCNLKRLPYWVSLCAKTRLLPLLISSTVDNHARYLFQSSLKDFRSSSARIASDTDGRARTSAAGSSHDLTFFLTPISHPLPSPRVEVDVSSIASMSTEWSSAMRAPIHRLIVGSRISEDVNVVDSKYSSTRPFSNVPYTRGPIRYLEERICNVWSSRGRDIREPDEGPYIRSRSVRGPCSDGQETKNTAFVKDPETL